MSNMDLDGFDDAAETTSSSLPKHSDPRQALKYLDETWYFHTTRRSRWMDLIGDYAGTELFIIDGEALFQQVLNDPLLALGRIDDPSFQGLHALWSLEHILSEFKTRSASFEIVFWRDNRHSTSGIGSREFVVASRMLARAMMYKHLHLLDITIHLFDDLADPRWLKYLSSTKPMFVMTNDGGTLSNDSLAFTAERILTQRVFIFDLLSQGCSVSLLQGAEYRDSKIMSFVYEQRHDRDARKRLDDAVWVASSVAIRSLEAQESHTRRGIPAVSLAALTPQRLQPPSQEGWLKVFIKEVLSSRCLSPTFGQDLLFIFVAHLLVVPTLSLEARARSLERSNSELTKDLLSSFLPGVFVSLEAILSQSDRLDVDGRVYLTLINFLVAQPDTSLRVLLGENIGLQLEALWSSLELPPVDLSSFASRFPSSPNMHISTVATKKRLSLLPFEHPLFNEELASVRIDADEQDATLSQSQMDFKTVFTDVYHWHNNRRSILPPHLGGEEFQPMDERQRRRKLRSDQRFMATMEWQAQTLQGAFGIPLVRMVILSTRSRASSSKHNSDARMIEARAVKPNKKGKPERLSAADKIRQANMDKKQLKEDDSNQTWWQEQLKGCLQQSTNQQIEAMDKLQRNKRTLSGWLSVEFRLFRLHLELTRWIETTEREDSEVRNQTVVRILRLVKEIYDQKELFPTALRILDGVLAVTGLSTITPELKAARDEANSDRVLCFKFVKLQKSKTGSAVHKFMHIEEDPVVWQLRFFGEYMDRSMDSQPDRRVSFQPDAWQRKVLDCLDDNQSVLVVAPTSAGKTFISYYAMEQVLRASDDGILVYVAPTKALVSQIAAEVYARFRKDLNGKSCWAIHTRDYRVHDPQNCQILVTVPEMLAIMLLSPPLARVWTPRIKRIILDEIHSIGQQQGGAVWEQIILLAPCPIIGLSATIGHPENFNTWLQSVQEAHGFSHTFINYPNRYSHLRKFFYIPRAKLEPYTGLSAHLNTGHLKFLHPVSMLSFGVQELPPDFTLEASDCLSLFQAFYSFRDEIPFDIQELDPSRFFLDPPVNFLKQKDVLRYEAALKAKLVHLLAVSDPQNPASVLSRIISSLVDPDLSHVDAQSVPSAQIFLKNLIFLVSDLHASGDLPAILFNFDRKGCEVMGQILLTELEKAESAWRESSPEWARKLQQWERWQSQSKNRERQAQRQLRQKKDNDESQFTDSQAPSWESLFDPSDPSPEFSFAGVSIAYSKTELEDEIRTLARWGAVPNWALTALRRGIGIHHAGMNKRYRSLVESLYRLGFLRVVIATGTLALGINAPTRTSVFCGDSPFLTALMYRQCAGRAGRRGFDLLGKVVFFGLSMDRCHRLVVSRLPSLGSNWPLTTTMVLRLFNLLQGSNNAPFATSAIRSLLRLPHMSSTSDIGKEQILHFLRFSIDYLRRAGLLDSEGNAINLFGIAAHLYYTEPSNIALVALFRQGVIHRICSQKDTLMARRDFLLLMCHLFGRRYVPKSYSADQNIQELIKKSPSMVVLPALPEDARRVLGQQDREILDVFTSYALAYADQYTDRLGPDNQMPLSKESIMFPSSNLSTPFRQHLHSTTIPVAARSLFVANSGHGDNFHTVEELSWTARRGLHLNQYAMPAMTQFTATTDHGDNFALNAYLLDFFIHGQPAALKKANAIRDNDIWYLLEDFALTLKTIRAGVGQLLLAASTSAVNDDDGDVETVDDIDSGYGTYSTVVDEEADEDPISLARPIGVSDEDWKVYEVIDAVTVEFDTKFKAMWA